METIKLIRLVLAIGLKYTNSPNKLPFFICEKMSDAVCVPNEKKGVINMRNHSGASTLLSHDFLSMVNDWHGFLQMILCDFSTNI